MTWQSTTALLSIAFALTLGAMSPGPSFILVARTSLALSRRDGFAVAVGMGVGGVFFSAIALLGLLAVLATVPLLHFALKFLGGVYLLYLAYRIWRGAHQALVLEGAVIEQRPARLGRSFLLGLVTQVSNPKTAVVYGSVFASLLPDGMPMAFLLALPLMVFAIETLWYSVVVLALSAPAPRARYLASKAWLDRAAGTILAALGIKLIVEAPQA